MATVVPALRERSFKALSASASAKTTNCLIAKETATLADSTRSFPTENASALQATPSAHAESAFFPAKATSSPSKDHALLAHSTQSSTPPSTAALALQVST